MRTSSSLSKGHKEIIRHLACFVNLKPKQLIELTGSHPKVVYYQLQTLGPNRRKRWGEQIGTEVAGRGLVNYVLEGADSLRNEEKLDPWEIERVYFLTQRGWDLALELGFIQHRVNANDEKSNQNTAHDLKLTEIHLAAWRRYKNRLHWFQYRPYIYARWDKGEEDFVKPDAFFWLDCGDHFPAYFVEVEMHRETNKNPDGDLLAKMRRFANFAKGNFQAEAHFADFSDFRLATYRYSQTLAENMARKTAADGLATRRFWFTSIPDAIRGEERFVTPRDHDPNTHKFTRDYSLSDA